METVPGLLLRLRMTGDRWKPDDAVREIHIVRGYDESVQALYELGHGQFFGKNDAGMRAFHVMPLLGKAKIVSVIEGQDGASLACRKGQLFFIGKAEVSCVTRGQAINAPSLKHYGQRQVNVFVKLEFHSRRKPRRKARQGRESISGAERCSAISRSMSSRLS